MSNNLDSVQVFRFFIIFVQNHLLIFFKIIFLEKFFQEYHQSVKQFGSRSGPIFAMVISRQQKMLLAGKEGTHTTLYLCYFWVRAGRVVVMPLFTGTLRLEGGTGVPTPATSIATVHQQTVTTCVSHRITLVHYHWKREKIKVKHL